MAKTAERLKMEDILKPGAVLTARLLIAEEVRISMQEVERKQAEIRKLIQIDGAKLQNTFITI